MLSERTSQIRELEHNLADLYIGHNNDRLFRRNNIDSNYKSSTNNANGDYWTDVNGRKLYGHGAEGYSYSLVIDFHDKNELCRTADKRSARFREWAENRRTMKYRAQKALAKALSPTYSVRQYAMKGSSLYAERQNINATVKATLKRLPHPKVIDPNEQPAQFHNNLMAWVEAIVVVPLIYSSIGEVIARLTRGTPASVAAAGFMARLWGYSDAARSGCRTPVTGERWQKAVWASEAWFKGSKHYFSHALHVSTSSPSLLAYHQNGDKMMRNIQTQVKPGRYLQQFFSDVLSEKDIRYWAERQQAYSEASELKFVPNTDPDGWVWVYEHPSGFSSCMQWNHSSRYMDSRLAPDTPYHPVRAYCHPKNNLALAYLGDDYKKFPDGRVFARAIVNTRDKTYVRIYGDSRIERQLEAAGYSYDSDETLKGEKLQVIELPWGGYAMPYLDGGCTMVDRHCDYFKVVYDGEYDAQNSSGMIESESITCPCCGDSVEDDDDLTYVECRGESICQDCLDENYRYAYGRRGYQDYHHVDDCVLCESDSEWYTYDYASDNDVYECPVRGRYYRIDDLVPATCGDYEDQYIHESVSHELPDGEVCAAERYENDFDTLLAEHSGEDEDDESEDDTPEQEFPCAPVISATPSDEQFSIAA